MRREGRTDSATDVSREHMSRTLHVLRLISEGAIAGDRHSPFAVHGVASELADSDIGTPWEELSAFLSSAGAVETLRAFRSSIVEVIPELEAIFDFDQHNPYHTYDVWEHTLHALAAATPDTDPLVRLAVLLHDIAKPQCFSIDENGCGHMYGHDEAGADIARDICRRLGMTDSDGETVAYLIRWHMFSIPETPKSVRRFLRKHGEERTQQLMAVRHCDRSGHGKGPDPDSRLSRAYGRAQRLIAEELAREPEFSMRDLAINGRDMMMLGVPEGPAIGIVLEQLFSEVQESKTPNTREALLGRAREIAPR